MRKILILFCGLLVGSCSAYKIDIQQGNTLDQRKVEQLSLGMNKQQVAFLLGTPMLQDPFHAQRWDYLYRLSQDGKQAAHSNLVLYFEGDALVRIDASRHQPDAFPKN